MTSRGTQVSNIIHFSEWTVHQRQISCYKVNWEIYNMKKKIGKIWLNGLKMWRINDVFFCFFSLLISTDLWPLFSMLFFFFSLAMCSWLLGSDEQRWTRRLYVYFFSIQFNLYETNGVWLYQRDYDSYSPNSVLRSVSVFVSAFLFSTIPCCCSDKIEVGSTDKRVLCLLLLVGFNSNSIVIVTWCHRGCILC